MSKPTQEQARKALQATPEGRFVAFANDRTAQKAAKLGTTPRALRMALCHRALGTTPTDSEEARVLALLPSRA